MRFGLVSEVTTSCVSAANIGQDNFLSWVRAFYGTNKYVIDSNHNITEVFADPHEDQTSQISVKVIAARLKATAKERTCGLITEE